MTILLDYYKAKTLTIDLKEFYRKYDNPRTPYRLLQCVPLLVNVEGSYIKAFDIPELVVNRNWRVLSALNQWLLELKNPPNEPSKEIINFRWKR